MSKEDKKVDTPDTGIADAEGEFDAAWEDAVDDEPTTPEPKPEASGATPDDDKPDDTKPEGDDSSGDPPPPESNFEKRFKDTQSAFTKERQKTKELEEEIERLKSDPDGEGDSQLEPPESLKELEEDDPSVVESMRFIAQEEAAKGGDSEGVKTLQEEVDHLREELAQSRFNAAVVAGYIDPESKKFVKGHPDAFELMATDDFEKFYEEQRNEDATLQSEDLHPSQAISLIGRFKEAVASRGADAHDQRTAEERQKVEENLADGVDETQGGTDSARPTAQATGLGGQEAEFDAAWDEF